MCIYSRSHLSDPSLLRSVAAHVAQDRTNMAELLADLAEVDSRKLYLPAAYSSMYAWCMDELHFCEQAAYKRILAARTARRFPAIFAAVADGRLHLSAVVLLARHLTEETASELLAAAAHKSKAEIERLLADRFPRPDLPTVLEAVSALPSPVSFRQLSPGIVATIAPDVAEPLVGAAVQPSAPCQTELSAPARIEAPVPRPRVIPLAPDRFALQAMISQSTQDKLRRALELLSHEIPSGDLAQVLEQLIDLGFTQLEKRRFAATDRPRPGHRRSRNPRCIPADVKRAVWERDHGQCTFVSDTGQRCPARTLIQFDHVDEVARGGRATVGNPRLRCRAHNQYTAERTFGTEFMKHKVERAREAATARAIVVAEREPIAAAEQAEEHDVAGPRRLPTNHLGSAA